MHRTLCHGITSAKLSPCSRFDVSVEYPIHTLEKYQSRYSQSIGNPILCTSGEYCHALRDKIASRSITLCFPEPLEAPLYALRILRSGNQAGRGRWAAAFHGSPGLSPNSRTGTGPTGASEGVFGRKRCTMGPIPGSVHRYPPCGAQKGSPGAAVWRNPFVFHRIVQVILFLTPDAMRAFTDCPR